MKRGNNFRILNLALVLAVFFALGGAAVHASESGDACLMEDGTAGNIENTALDANANTVAGEAAIKKDAATLKSSSDGIMLVTAATDTDLLIGKGYTAIGSEEELNNLDAGKVVKIGNNEWVVVKNAAGTESKLVKCGEGKCTDNSVLSAKNKHYDDTNSVFEKNEQMELATAAGHIKNPAATSTKIITDKNVEISKNTDVKKDGYVYVSEESDDGSVKQYVYKKIGNDQYVRCLSGEEQTISCQTDQKYTFTQLEEKKSDGGSIIKINAGGATLIKGQEEKAAQESKAKVDSISTTLAEQIMKTSNNEFFDNHNNFKDDALEKYAKQQCKEKGIECSDKNVQDIMYNTKVSIADKSSNAVMKVTLNKYLYLNGKTPEQQQKAKEALFEPFKQADGTYSYVDGIGKTHEIKPDDFKEQTIKTNGKDVKMLIINDPKQCAGYDRCTFDKGNLVYVDAAGKIGQQLSGFDKKELDKDKKNKFSSLTAILTVPSHKICSFKNAGTDGKTTYESKPCLDNPCIPGATNCEASADISYSGATKLLMGNEAYEQWLAKVDEIFTKYLPLTPDALSERMCKNFQQMPNGQNAAFVESPGGILNPAAHIQGERTTVLDIEINDTSLSETDCTANPESPECQQYSAASLTGTDETNTNTETAIAETATDEETGTNDLTTAAVMIDRITGKAAGLPSGSASGIDTITGAGTNVAYEDIEAGEGEEANFTIVRKYVYKITWFVKNVQVQGSDPTLEYQLVLKGPGGVQEASNLKSLEEGASDGRAVTAPYTFADKRLFTSACLRFSKGYSKFKGMSGSELCNSIVDSSKKATVVDVGVPAGAQGSGAGSAEAGKFKMPDI